ncbi:peptidoglycan DD-metalloendopeptidase family protein [Kineobactrum salinum]|uniref:Peptidoglycan DD-metalloendopeptidase family protein n=1 Tax=Kineobactrum salinum TaxID=2708301 RepID=A0A6C0UBL9_9GAMM|nr:peptidoglycan DD-metalloendopeptidase family protein [Kineobactrum salinum]
MTACAGGPPAPIEDRRTPATTHLPLPADSYVVRRGDTLYSIAFRFGQDYREVAARNGIRAPYTIHPGQRLRVIGDATGSAARSGHAVRHTPPPEPISSGPAEATAPRRDSTVSPDRGASRPSSPARTTPVPPQRPPASATRPPAAPPTAAAVLAPVTAWRWPTPGRVTRGYSATVHKGIDIGGQRGDPVVAVAAGQVVYAGTGIVGFGELLIVKHDDVHLSAYGHNDRLLVAEGELVRAGQEIAKKGSTGTDSVKLHFEIRREGKPLDPLHFLPPR